MRTPSSCRLLYEVVLSLHPLFPNRIEAEIKCANLADCALPDEMITMRNTHDQDGNAQQYAKVTKTRKPSVVGPPGPLHCVHLQSHVYVSACKEIK